MEKCQQSQVRQLQYQHTVLHSKHSLTLIQMNALATYPHTHRSLSHTHTNTGQGAAVYCFLSHVVFLNRLSECLPNRLSCHGLIGFLTQFQFAPLLLVVLRLGAVMRLCKMCVCAPVCGSSDVCRGFSLSLATSSPACWNPLSLCHPPCHSPQRRATAGAQSRTPSLNPSTHTHRHTQRRIPPPSLLNSSHLLPCHNYNSHCHDHCYCSPSILGPL